MKKKDFFITTGFLMIIFGMCFMITFFKNEKGLLYFENRNIKECPTLNYENVFENNYFGDVEEHLSDSFKLRNRILKFDTFLNLKLLKRPVVNGIYKSDKHYMTRWQRWWPYDYKEDLEKMTLGYKGLNEALKAKGVYFLYVGVPEHSYVFSDDYPKYLLNKYEEWHNIEEDFFTALNQNNISNIKMSDFIKDKEMEYTKTDHHFSYIGAKNVYENIIQKINENTEFKLDGNVELVKMPEPFKGSYSRKLFFVGGYNDDYYTYNPDFEFERFDDGEKTLSKLFFPEENKFDGAVGYGVYMNGDKGFTKIATHRENLPNILVYGDSFTNPLETLLVRNANNFYSFDFRYQKNKTLTEIVDEYNPDIVICIRDNLMYLNREENGIVE